MYIFSFVCDMYTTGSPATKMMRKKDNIANKKLLLFIHIYGGMKHNTF